MVYYKWNDEKKAAEPCDSLQELIAASDDGGITKSLFRNKYGKGQGVLLSTVFLSVDHGFGGAPVLFETMLFIGGYDIYQRRFSSYDVAATHHELTARYLEDDIFPTLRKTDGARRVKRLAGSFFHTTERSAVNSLLAVGRQLRKEGFIYG